MKSSHYLYYTDAGIPNVFYILEPFPTSKNVHHHTIVTAIAINGVGEIEVEDPRWVFSITASATTKYTREEFWKAIAERMGK